MAVDADLRVQVVDDTEGLGPRRPMLVSYAGEGRVELMLRDPERVVTVSRADLEQALRVINLLNGNA